MPHKLGMNHLGRFDYQSLFAGSYPRADIIVTLKAGQIYPLGSVLGRDTASGVCALVDSTKSDGTETVYGILSEEVDATDEDRESVAYVTGEYVEQRLTFGGNDDPDTHRAAAEEKHIFFRKAALQPNE